jgi:hypothetical protein
MCSKLLCFLHLRAPGSPWNFEQPPKIVRDSFPSDHGITQSLALIFSSDVASAFFGSGPRDFVSTGKRWIVRDAACCTARLCGSV